MIEPAAIAVKAQRLYPRLVKAWLEGQLEEWFPLSVAVNLCLPESIAATIDAVTRLREGAKPAIGYGYTIHWASRRSRSHGLNDYPDAISLDSVDDVIRLAGKHAEFQALESAVERLRGADVRLEGWLREGTNWKRLLQVSAELDDLLLVLRYFQDHPRPGCYAREIPLAISTKRIEQNRNLLSQWLDRVLPADAIDYRYKRDEFEPRYGLRYPQQHYLIRILDTELQTELGLPVEELSLPADGLAGLPVRDSQVMIVENKINLLTLPPIRRGIALGGLGNAITQLASVPWLATSPVRYWGDLDVEGLQILGRLRQQLPHLQSFLMDRQTLDTWGDYVIRGNQSSTEAPQVGLTDAEQQLYRDLQVQRWRLEQERIPQTAVAAALQILEQQHVGQGQQQQDADAD